MKKRCFCYRATTECADCRAHSFMITGQDFDNVQSALQFFVDNYKKSGSAQAKRDMISLNKRMWKFFEKVHREPRA